MEKLEKLTGVYIIKIILQLKILTLAVRYMEKSWLKFEDNEYRIWEPRRSKLGAAILNGIKTFPFEKNQKYFTLVLHPVQPHHISQTSLPKAQYGAWSSLPV